MVAGPSGPVTVTVPPDTVPTSPRARSLPLSPVAPGVGLDGDDEGDALLVAGLLAEVLAEVEDADGVLDEPQAASESAANPVTATSAYRCAQDEMTMVTPFLAGLSACLDSDMKSLCKSGCPVQRSVGLPLEHPCRDPVGHGLAAWAVRDLVGDQAPPEALLADALAGEPTVDDRVHLQSGRVVAAGVMRLARKQRGEVHEHRDRRIDAAKRLLDGLPVVADRLELTHCSIIRSNRLLSSASARLSSA
jgi:hypothetical protein